jgi:hypothetical protein
MDGPLNRREGRMSTHSLALEQPPRFHVVAADGRPLGWITRATQALAQEDVEVIFPNSGVRIECPKEDEKIGHFSSSSSIR